MARSPSVALIALLLAGCSTGLTALGDTDLIPTDPNVDTDVDDTDLPLDTDDTDVPAPNNAPNADAGADQTGLVGAVIELDASGSSDPDGDTLAYLWIMQSSPGGWTGEVINDTRVDAQFFANQPGTYVVELQVDDGEFAASDTVTVVVEQPNEVPVANAGADQYVDEGDLVQLVGTGSYDPDSDPLDYYWTIIDGPVGSGAILSSPTSPLPTFTAAVAGVYSVELVVTDTNGNQSFPDVVRVTAQGSSSTGGDSGCLSCIAAQQQLRGRTHAAGLLLLPLLVAGLRRRR